VVGEGMEIVFAVMNVLGAESRQHHTRYSSTASQTYPPPAFTKAG
jgi:hypothetical protein